MFTCGVVASREVPQENMPLDRVICCALLEGSIHTTLRLKGFNSPSQALLSNRKERQSSQTRVTKNAPRARTISYPCPPVMSPSAACGILIDTGPAPSSVSRFTLTPVLSWSRLNKSRRFEADDIRGNKNNVRHHIICVISISVTPR